ncbi:MAG: RDD family protein [Gemmatimonadetes bacterium]|nr:MAG: RDD family protein [Gemmatimonadota bacterium]
MYFAILMPRMKGATPGKRIMGVRVVRLDGQPITWWHAFERAGGYAAGLATGLLGFLQVYWDPNRQAIHDKVAGTVVIVDGAPRVPGTWVGDGPPAAAPHTRSSA